MAALHDTDVKADPVVATKDLDYEDVVDHVEQRYRGTDADKLDMRVLGRTQETRRMFTTVTMLGFGSTMVATWEMICATMLPVLNNGGTAGLFWGFLLIAGGYVMVYASLAEMASMAATSGGQYVWVSEFAPPSTQKYLSYMTGWLTLTGWQSAITAVSMVIATVIQGLAVLHNPDYEPTRWQATLLTIAVVAVCLFFNTFLARRLPLVEGSLAVVHFVGLFVTIIVLWTLLPLNNAKDAFTKFNNTGGWPSDGLSMLVGIYPFTMCLLGFDSQVHMAEETSDASRAMPLSIMYSTYANGCLGMIMVATLIFTIGDLDSIIDTPTGYPFIKLFMNATGSKAGTTVLTVMLMLPILGSVIACMATASRQIWSFARDNGVPFSSTIRYVYPRFSIPLNAVVLSLVVCVFLSMVNIGSTAALNAILAVDLCALLCSYSLSIGCLLLKRIKGEPLPPRKWTLGKYGAAINIGALCWLLPIFVITFFPPTTNPTAEGMNWGILLFGFMVIFSAVYYLIYGKHQYISPKARMHRELQGM